MFYRQGLRELLPALTTGCLLAAWRRTYDLDVVGPGPVGNLRRHGLRRPLVICWSEPRPDSLNECGAPPPPALVRTLRRFDDLSTYCARGGPAATGGSLWC